VRGTGRPPRPRAPVPGLARERTELAWTRTALAFAAVGAVIARRDLIIGLAVLACTPLIWAVGGWAAPPARAGRPGRLLLVTVAVTGVAVLAGAVALFGHAPASLSQLLPLHG
jgi:uncharacterized membrane protein YidH (DUF202 family)